MAKPTEKCADIATSNYRDIAGEEECKKASEHFGAPFKKTIKEWDWPKGCHITKTLEDGENIASVFFNKHSQGTQNSKASSVCTNCK